MKWNIQFYNSKVEKWINDMPVGFKAYYARITERIKNNGPNIGMPYTKALGKGLFEIRLKATEGISRVFYCTIKDNTIILLHGIIKKTQKIPKKELLIARKRQLEVKYVYTKT